MERPVDVSLNAEHLRISVALCTFNGARFVAEQLRSVLGQSRIPEEIVIHDDLSNDDTAKILGGFVTQHPDRIRVSVARARRGAVANFAAAIGDCTGDIIFLCDQDDVWRPDKVETMSRAFQGDPRLLCLFTNGSLIDERSAAQSGSLWESWKFDNTTRTRWLDNQLAFDDLVRNKNHVTGATVAFRSTLRSHFMPLTPPGGYWHDCWIAMYAAKYDGLRYMDKCLIDYRVHPSQAVGLGNGVQVRRSLRGRLAGAARALLDR